MKRLDISGWSRNHLESADSYGMKQSNDKRGVVVLIETVVAIAILILITGRMLEIFSQGFGRTRRLQQSVVAHNIARQTLEEFFNWRRIQLEISPSGTPPTFPILLNLPQQTFNDITYTPTLTITPGGPFLMELRVDVTWGTENYTLTTQKTNY